MSVSVGSMWVQSGGEWKIETPTPIKSVLAIVPSFRVHLREPMPNRWHRFWYRVLLGWTWRKP